MRKTMQFYRVIFALFMMIGAQSLLAADKLKPFILANAASGSLQEASAETEKALHPLVLKWWEPMPLMPMCN